MYVPIHDVWFTRRPPADLRGARHAPGLQAAVIYDVLLLLLLRIIILLILIMLMTIYSIRYVYNNHAYA